MKSLLEAKDDFFFFRHDISESSFVRVEKSGHPVQAKIILPGSKSFTNRALVLAAMTGAEVMLSGFLFAEDTYWGLSALEQLGFSLLLAENSVLLRPPFNNETETRQSVSLFLGKAGTLARFFPSVILNWQKTFPAQGKMQAVLTGDPQLIKRPLADLVLALRQLGGSLTAASLPFRVESSHLSGNCTISGNVSSQFLSGLLLAASGAKNEILIKRKDDLVQPDYVRMTLAAIRSFGLDIIHDSNLSSFRVNSVSGLHGTHYQIEADASTLCYFLSLAVLHNFSLTVSNIGRSTLQPDFRLMEILNLMGAKITADDKNITVHKQQEQILLKGGCTFDMGAIGDQAVTLGVLALFADAPITIKGVAHIRAHECNRVSCFVKNLAKLGLRCEEHHDGFTVYPLGKNNLLAGVWETWNDHRFAMSGFLLASRCSGICIKNPRCVEKTVPDFFNLTEKLGFNSHFYSFSELTK